LGLLGIEHLARLQPPILDGVSTHHPLAAPAAGELGVPAGIPVVLGYVDVVCTAVGGGLSDASGDVGLSILGSTAMHMRLERDRSRIRLNDLSTGYTMAYPLPGACAQMQSSMSATLNIDWLLALVRDILGPDAPDRSALLADLERMALAAEPARLLYHPYIAASGERGPFHDANARAQFTGLDSTMRFPDLVRAVFEGIAFAALDCFDALGHTPAEIRVTGGGARSAALRKILSTALDRPVRRNLAGEEGARGAAMIAMVALGAAPDMDACAATWVAPHLAPPEPPDRDLARIYARSFPIYRQTREAMADVWAQLAAARTALSPSRPCNGGAEPNPSRDMPGGRP
jgi:erythritol kinase